MAARRTRGSSSRSAGGGSTSDPQPTGLLDALAVGAVLTAIVRLLDPQADDIGTGFLSREKRLWLPLSSCSRQLRSAVFSAVPALRVINHRRWLSEPQWLERFTGVRRLDLVGAYTDGKVREVLDAFRERAGVVPKMLRIEQPERGVPAGGAQQETQLQLPQILESLRLGHPSPKVTEQIAQLTLLRSLKLSVRAEELTQATASIPCLTRLTFLDFEDVYLFSRSHSADVAWQAALQAVGALPQLRELTVGVKTHEKLAGPLDMPNGALSLLRKLSINSNTGKDSAGLGPGVLHDLLAAATGLTRLVCLGVEGGTFDAQNIEAMCRMTALQELVLTGTFNASHAPVITPALLLRLPTLRSLRTLLLNSNSQDSGSITDARLLEMAVSMPALEELTLMGCRFLTDATIWGLLMATTPKLRVLKMSHNRMCSLVASLKMQQLAEARGLKLEVDSSFSIDHEILHFTENGTPWELSYEDLMMLMSYPGFEDDHW